MKKAKRNVVRLYAFWNMEQGRSGTPFALCDKHRELQKVPDSCYLSLLANKPTTCCVKCAEEGEAV